MNIIKPNQSVAALFPLLLATFLCLTYGCTEKKTQEKRICVIKGDYTSGQQLVIAELDNAEQNIEDPFSSIPSASDTLIVFKGESVEGLSDAMCDSIVDAYTHNASIIIFEPTSGQWLRLWRKLIAAFDRKEQSKMPDGDNADKSSEATRTPRPVSQKAIANINAMRNEMIDVEEFTGLEPSFNIKIAEAIGIRESDFYYQTDSLSPSDLRSWLSQTSQPTPQ